MTDVARSAARLTLIAYLRALPLDADVSLDVRGLSRSDFDELFGEAEMYLHSSRCWTKDIDVGPGAAIELWTDEPPHRRREIRIDGDVVAVVSERIELSPPRTELRLVKEDG